jgi:hypothetical protein
LRTDLAQSSRQGLLGAAKPGWMRPGAASLQAVTLKYLFALLCLFLISCGMAGDDDSAALDDDDTVVADDDDSVVANDDDSVVADDDDSVVANDDDSVGDDDSIGDDDDDSGHVRPPEPPEEPEAPDCPGSMIGVATGTWELGESDSDWLIPSPYNSWRAEYPGLDLLGLTTIPLSTLTIPAFCMDRFPFPGIEGESWPADGLNFDTVRELDEVLADFDRRPCTVSELLLAGAGPNNWRFPYDPGEHLSGMCEEDDFNPGPIGRMPMCISPLGFRDVLVRSVWARLDPTMGAALAPHGIPIYPPWEGAGFVGSQAYVVYGGTSRQGTFYNSSNYGVHSHTDSVELFLDDGFRVCANPGVPDPVVEAAWQDFLAEFLIVGSYHDWLGLD